MTEAAPVYTLEHAIALARLWKAGKLLGGDEDAVIFALLDGYDALAAANLKLRDKLLELAKECTDCDGTGLQTILGEAGPCPACEDIRAVLE